MSDLGYYQQIEGGIYGQPDNPTSPEQIAALAEQTFQANLRIREGLSLAGELVPDGAGYGASAPMWATQAGGPANLPRSGWTAQNDVGSPGTPFGPYTTKNLGRIPDWEGFPNPLSAGQYDMNQALGGVMAPGIGTAPIGDAVMQYDDGGQFANPNSVPRDDESLVEPFEY